MEIKDAKNNDIHFIKTKSGSEYLIKGTECDGDYMILHQKGWGKGIFDGPFSISSIIYIRKANQAETISWTKCFGDTKESKPKESSFYMIYLEGSRSPTYKHYSLEGAENEAERLSKVHNSTAYILKAKSKVTVLTKTKTEKLGKVDNSCKDGLPF